MKIKYSALVSATSGKLNGSVAASNRGGAYLRNKGVTSNPQTISQQLNRASFGAISSQFRSLTPDQITAWNLAAQDFPVIDRFGDTRYLSGLALFVQLNKNLNDIGLPGISNPPAKQSFPNITAISARLNISEESTALLVELTADAVVPATLQLIVSATPSVSPSIRFVKNRYRLIGSEINAGSATLTYEDLEQYSSVVGSPVVGNAVYFQAVIISTVSGEKSAPFLVSTIVTDEI